MIIRPSAKLLKKIKLPSVDYKLGLHPNPYLDWSCHLFTATRVQHILVINTASLFSIIFPGKGINSPKALIETFLNDFGIYMLHLDSHSIIEDNFDSPAPEITFSKQINRSVIASINDRAYHAECYLEQSPSCSLATEKLNEMPSLVLNDCPCDLFFKMDKLKKGIQQ